MIEPVLLGPDGKPAPRARRVSRVPRDPRRSEIEVLIDTPWSPVLPEDVGNHVSAVLLDQLPAEVNPLVRHGKDIPLELVR